MRPDMAVRGVGDGPTGRVVDQAASESPLEGKPRMTSLPLLRHFGYAVMPRSGDQIARYTESMIPAGVGSTTPCNGPSGIFWFTPNVCATRATIWDKGAS